MVLLKKRLIIEFFAYCDSILGLKCSNIVTILLINVGKIKPANLVVKMTVRLAGFYF